MASISQDLLEHKENQCKWLVRLMINELSESEIEGLPTKIRNELFGLKQYYMKRKELRDEWVRSEKQRLEIRKRNRELNQCNCCDSSRRICDYCKYHNDCYI